MLTCSHPVLSSTSVETSGVLSINIFLISQMFPSSRDYYQDLINHTRLLLHISHVLSLSLSLTAAICKLKSLLSSSNISLNLSILC